MSSLKQTISAIERAEPGIRWGISVLPSHGSPVHSTRVDDVVPIASVGKLLLLLAVSEGIAAGALDPDEPVSRRPGDDVRDSGIWQFMAATELPLGDLAVLVASVSDNLATNVLLRRIGFGPIERTRLAHGLEQTLILDRVRDSRFPLDPPAFAIGNARELAALAEEIRTAVAPATRRVAGWMRTNADLSMVAAPFELDPLAHARSGSGPVLASKTGSDATVRADVGFVVDRGGSVAWAAIANWDERNDRTEAALAGMRRLGAAIREAVTRSG